MSVEIRVALPSILNVVQDAVVRALRWDAVPDALVLDLDCALETLQRGDGRVVRLCRGWLVVEAAEGLTLNIQWGDFRSGFTIMEVIEESNARGKPGQKDFRIETDFPEGTVAVSGARMLLLRSRETKESESLELPLDMRRSLVTDEDLIAAYAEAKALSEPQAN